MLSTSTLAEEYIVEMQKHSFVPDFIEIKQGDSIKFINKSSMLHNVVIKDLKIITKYVKKDESLTLKFDTLGIFDYYCQPHKTMGMVGKIEVKK